MSKTVNETISGTIKVPITWIDKTTGEPFPNQRLTEEQKIDNYAATLESSIRATCPDLLSQRRIA